MGDDAKEEMYGSYDFQPPQKFDYLECKENDHGAANCKVIRRIVHFIQYYEHQKNINESNAIIPIHEYIESLNGYDIETFLEDWYQSKLLHLHKDEDVEWIQKAINIQCDQINACQYVQRYQRDREKDAFDLY